MHGLMNRAVQDFLQVTYGQATWEAVREAADLPENGFEPLLSYDDALTTAMLSAAVDHLEKPREDILADIGTFLVSHPRTERVRRLLRFGGAEFGDFLHSLDDLPARVGLALPAFHLPRMTLRVDEAGGEGAFLLTCDEAPEGWGHVMMGVIAAMADDYGALVLLEHRDASRGCGDAPSETIGIRLMLSDYADARAFDLTLGAA